MWFGYQAAFDWIAMHVAQFLHPLGFGPHIEIVKACLPNAHRLRLLVFAPLPALPRHDSLCVELLYQLHHFGGVSYLRFADQEMKVIGHYYVAEYDEAMALAYFFQDGYEQIATWRCVQPRNAVVTTAGYEVRLSGAVIPLEAGRHWESVFAEATRRM